MDIDIVNAVLRLCYERQTCLFEVPTLCEYCAEQRLCTNSKYILASIKNYMEIFKISRDRNRIEFFMPFEICRFNFRDGVCEQNGETCQNLHACYEYFYTNSCRRSVNCPNPHQLTQKYHENILRTLVSLDLDTLTKAVRVYCQSKRHLLNYNSSILSSSKVQHPPASSSSFSKQRTISPLLTSASSSLSLPNNKRSTVTAHIDGNITWKTNNRTVLTSTSNSTSQQIKSQIAPTGLQISWTPENDIPNHFAEIVFSNQSKSDGGPIQTYTVYQHLGIAQIFFKNSDTAERVIRHGPAAFQTYTFTSRLLQRTVDMRHVCFLNVSIDSKRIPLYIDIVSKPYKKVHFEYYQNDKQTILVEYNEDIDFAKISSNVRSYPEDHGLQIKCIQLYHPETLLVEFDKEYSECDIKNLFKNENIFHMKAYPSCAFVHFYCHDDLLHSIKTPFDDPIRVTPIYIDAYSQRHLDNYLNRTQSEVKSRSSSSSENQSATSTDFINETDVLPSEKTDDVLHQNESIVPTLPSPLTDQQIENDSKLMPPTINEFCSSTEVQTTNVEIPTIETNDRDDEEDDDSEILASDDDFEDLPSEFSNDDLFVDESLYEYNDLEFIRTTAKRLMASLAEMEETNENTDKIDEPKLLLYSDDYAVTIKSHRFALAFLDYTQFRIEKQCNPARFRLLSSLKKNIDNNKKQIDDTEQDDTLSTTSNIDPDLLGTSEVKSNKKNRKKRNKKRKITNNNNQNDTEDKVESTVDAISEEDEDDSISQTIHDQGNLNKNSISQRLPHVYLDDDLRPCILVDGEEHHEENGHDNTEYGDWHNIVAGGRQVVVSKKKKPPSKVQISDQTSTNTPTVANTYLQPEANQQNSSIIPKNCRGFVHNPKLFETFRLRLRRSFPSINIHFQSNNYTLIIKGNNQSNVQQCLNYLNLLNSYKRSVIISYEDFPKTTIKNIIRMQQSTAQIKLDNQADYNRIFRSTYRLIDYQLKQFYNQQQCIYCRRSNKKFKVTYLEFSCDKQSTEELNDSIKQRIIQLLTTRFTYIAIALSADLMTTKRWEKFYESFCKHKELNKTLLIRRINTIIQIYGLNTHVQQIQILITKFVDVNRYVTDIVESEQAGGIFSLFKKDFQDMENLEVFREAELRIIYRHRRHILLVQCFQEKFEMVQSQIQKLRSQLSTIIIPVKSPILSRHYVKSNEIQRIASMSTCIINIEQLTDHNRPNDCLINLKVTGRSVEKINLAQRLIKEFEEQRYSTKKIQNNDIRLFNEQDISSLQTECNRCNVSCKFDTTNNLIELEGLSGDFIQIENIIKDLCLTVARRQVDSIKNTFEWLYYDPVTNKPMTYDAFIKHQIENCYQAKIPGLITFKDTLGNNRTFDLQKMIEISPGRYANRSPTTIRIERRDFKNPPSIQLPVYWTAMTKPWECVSIGKRDNITEWKANPEIQRLIQLPEMLSESWILEIQRIQNPRIFQQYMTYKEKLAARYDPNERILYRLGQPNHVDDMCANGFNQSHSDSAFSTYGHGCHFYCKIKDINRAATLLAQNNQVVPIRLQQQTPLKLPVRYLFVCKVLVGRYTRGDSSMKTCPSGYESLVDNPSSPEVFVPSHDAQVLPEYLITYQSDIF